ncbi:hypothetical protein AeMF1_001567 [Aphanomyces euteiches]|nr:hypothetical protein AeMF1_001567 [Aphanomyces euteiches]
MAAVDNKMAVVWLDPTTNEAGGTIFLSGDEIHSMTTVSGLERHLTSRLNLPRRSKSSLTMYGQRLKAGGVSSYLPLLRTNIPRFVLWTRTLPLLIVPPSGKSAVVWVSPARDVAQLKLEVEAMLGIQPSYQRLVFNGRELRSKMSIASTGIQAYSAVRLKMRLRGGGGGFSKPKQSYGLPTWETTTWSSICYGLNIEGKCTNEECDAHGKQVVVQHNFEAFNLSTHKVVCPLCLSPFTPITCGFYQCKWRFEGVRYGSGMHMSSQWTEASNRKYHLFDASKGKTVQWLSLVVSVRPLDAKECPVCFEPLADRADGLESLPCEHCPRFCNLQMIAQQWAIICKLQNQSQTTCPSCSAPCPTCRPPANH